MVCEELEFLGIFLDIERNKNYAGTMTEVSDPEGKVKVLVIPTNEEYEIAHQCYSLVS
jgi:acetate kinase